MLYLFIMYYYHVLGNRRQLFYFFLVWFSFVTWGLDNNTRRNLGIYNARTITEDCNE